MLSCTNVFKMPVQIDNHLNTFISSWETMNIVMMWLRLNVEGGGVFQEQEVAFI